MVVGLIYAQIGGVWSWVCGEEWFSNAHGVLVIQGKTRNNLESTYQGVSRRYKREQFFIGSKLAREYTSFMHACTMGFIILYLS